MLQFNFKTITELQLALNDVKSKFLSFSFHLITFEIYRSISRHLYITHYTNALHKYLHIFLFLFRSFIRLIRSEWNADASAGMCGAMCDVYYMYVTL